MDMKVDNCKILNLVKDDFEDNYQLLIGSWIKSQSGNWHHVLRVIGGGYTQSTSGLSIQSRNEQKAIARVYIFDGHFTNIRDIDEMFILYKQIYIPNISKVEIELLEYRES